MEIEQSGKVPLDIIILSQTLVPLVGSLMHALIPPFIAEKLIGMTYVKGYKIDRKLVASMIEVDPVDREVDEYIRAIVHMFPRTSYKYIASAKERNVPIDQKDGHRALVIVLEVGDDEKALREKKIVVDATIEWAKPHVLVGPEVWEIA